MSAYIATERLFLTADQSEVVPDGDERAAFLLVGVGQSLPADVVERYGLTAPAPDVEPEPEPEAVQLDEDKAAEPDEVKADEPEPAAEPEPAEKPKRRSRAKAG